jgi:RNA polymerase sigma-70 factor (ECF subfamily)
VDGNLVALAQQGDQGAFGEIALAIGGRLFALAYRILRNHDLAEDATQQAIVTIWRRLPDLREADRFDAWATRIVVRACYREARRVTAHRSADLYELPTEPADEGASAVVSVEDRDQLDRGFRRLPLDQRAVLVLQHYLGLEVEEIAAALEVPLGTVKSRAHAARRAMRAALEADARPAATQERSA